MLRNGAAVTFQTIFFFLVVGPLLIVRSESCLMIRKKRANIIIWRKPDDKNESAYKKIPVIGIPTKEKWSLIKAQIT